MPKARLDNLMVTGCYLNAGDYVTKNHFIWEAQRWAVNTVDLLNRWEGLLDDPFDDHPHGHFATGNIARRIMRIYFYYVKDDDAGYLAIRGGSMADSIARLSADNAEGNVVAIHGSLRHQAGKLRLLRCHFQWSNRQLTR